MPTVQFTRHLIRYFPDLSECEVAAGTVSEAVAALDERWPGLGAYVVDERGRLRKHVNIFVNDVMVSDREGLSDALGPEDRLFVIQALSVG